MSRKKNNQKPRRFAEHRRFTLRVPTPDNWSPTEADGCVRVSVIDMGVDTPMVRTCVWGGDDIGLERDEAFGSVYEKNRAYDQRVKEVRNWGIVRMQDLIDMGFKGA